MGLLPHSPAAPLSFLVLFSSELSVGAAKASGLGLSGPFDHMALTRPVRVAHRTLSYMWVSLSLENLLDQEWREVAPPKTAGTGVWMGTGMAHQHSRALVLLGHPHLSRGSHYRVSFNPWKNVFLA